MPQKRLVLGRGAVRGGVLGWECASTRLDPHELMQSSSGCPKQEAWRGMSNQTKARYALPALLCRDQQKRPRLGVKAVPPDGEVCRLAAIASNCACLGWVWAKLCAVTCAASHFLGDGSLTRAECSLLDSKALKSTRKHSKHARLLAACLKCP